MYKSIELLVYTMYASYINTTLKVHTQALGKLCCNVIYCYIKNYLVYFLISLHFECNVMYYYYILAY